MSGLIWIQTVKMFDTLMVILKQFFRFFFLNQQKTKKHEGGKELQ